MKMRLLIALTAVALSAPASAMTYFLVADWYESGQHFCKYSNGTVLNVGIHLCPLHIEG